MGVFDKFLDIMKLNDDDYDDDFYDEEDEYFDDEEFDENLPVVLCSEEKYEGRIF